MAPPAAADAPLPPPPPAAESPLPSPPMGGKGIFDIDHADWAAAGAGAAAERDSGAAAGAGAAAKPDSAAAPGAGGAAPAASSLSPETQPPTAVGAPTPPPPGPPPAPGAGMAPPTAADAPLPPLPPVEESWKGTAFPSPPLMFRQVISAIDQAAAKPDSGAAAGAGAAAKPDSAAAAPGAGGAAPAASSLSPETQPVPASGGAKRETMGVEEALADYGPVFGPWIQAAAGAESETDEEEDPIEARNRYLRGIRRIKPRQVPCRGRGPLYDRHFMMSLAMDRW